ncbi:MAG: queuosine precursor transporter, partial [Pseudoxanthomonas sp.]
APLQWNLFGESGSLSFTVGTLLWPFVFVLTDTINEFFGRKGVRFVSWVAVALIVYGFLFAFLAIRTAPAGWWVGAAAHQGVPDYQAAFAAIFGQGMWSIGGSIVAFLLGQLIDVSVFHRIRNATGERHVWLRATGSTAVSQLVDSFVVIYIAFVLGPQHWSMQRFLAISTVNYGYKMLAAVAMIPLLYLMRHAIRAYLGHAREEQLRMEAAAE